MKINKLRSIFLLVVMFLSVSAPAFSQLKLMVCSYPRSGTHFLCYSIRNIASQSIFLERCHGFLRYNEVCQKKNRPPRINREHDYLIVIVRNYKECMLRNFDGKPELVFNHLKDDSNSHSTLRYFENLEHFDNWPLNRRLLVYYEDLLENPEKVLVSVSKFLKFSPTRLRIYLDRLDYHIKKSLERYDNEFKNTKFSGSLSYGKDVFFHSKKVNKEDLEKMDELASKRAPYLYNKYLKRYQEKNSK